jgi:rhodanese-related sulfurtransferase
MMSKSGSVRQNKIDRRVWIGLVIIAGVFVAALLLLQPGATSVSSLPREVTVAQAASMRDAGAFVLDVRQPDEWAEYHIADATLIPLGELSARIGEVPRDQDVLVVCRSGNRSASGRDLLLDAGVTRVTSMAGGLTQWQADGFPVVSGQ